MSGHCEYCGGPKPDHARFCGAVHKAAWHREHQPEGAVRSVRRLMKGRVSIVIWFDEHEAHRALAFEPGQSVVIAEGEETQCQDQLPLPSRAT